MFTWLELEQGFRRLRLPLHEHRLEEHTEGVETVRTIAGPARQLATVQFKMLAFIAGRRFRRVFSPKIEDEKPYFYIHDAEQRWYAALKLRGTSFQAETGTINRIAEAAADLCLVLHGTHPKHIKQTFLGWIDEHRIETAVIVMLLAFVGYIIRWGYGL